MSRPDAVRLLLDKAKQDEYVVDKLIPDPEAPDEAIGFHAQQAAEKLIKAHLALNNIEYPLIHRLEDLLDLASRCGAPLPSEFEETRFLTPFAVEFRYDALPSEPEEALDRPKLETMLKALRAWIEAERRAIETAE